MLVLVIKLSFYQVTLVDLSTVWSIINGNSVVSCPGEQDVLNQVNITTTEGQNI